MIGHTTRFAAAISGAGISNWISDYGTADIPRTKESEFFGPPWDPKAHEILRKQSPIEYVANVKTPTLFVDGESDAARADRGGRADVHGAAEAARAGADGPLSRTRTTAAGARGTRCTATTRN